MLFRRIYLAPEGEGGGGAPPDPATQGGGDTPPEQTAEPKFAGKYEGHDAALKGVNEARQHIGLDPVEGNLWGEGGMFTDRKAAEKHYGDLTAIMRSKGQSPGTPPEGQADPPAGEKPAEGETAVELGGEDPPAETAEELPVEQVIEKAGLDYETLAKQYQENGQLTDEQYEALKKQDPTMTRRNVDRIADGMVAKAQIEQQQAEQTKQTVYSMVGGEQQWQNLAQWAKQNLTQEQLQWYDQQVTGDNVTQASIEAGVTFLQKKHAEATGSSGSRPLANGGGTPSPDRPSSPREIKSLLERSKRGDKSADEQLKKVDRKTLAQMSI